MKEACKKVAIQAWWRAWLQHTHNHFQLRCHLKVLFKQRQPMHMAFKMAKQQKKLCTTSLSKACWTVTQEI